MGRCGAKGLVDQLWWFCVLWSIWKGLGLFTDMAGSTQSQPSQVAALAVHVCGSGSVDFVTAYNYCYYIYIVLH